MQPENEPGHEQIVTHCTVPQCFVCAHLSDKWNVHSKAFQPLFSDSGPFVVRLGAGFFPYAFIPRILQLPQPQHYLVLLLFIRCFYYQTDHYVHVISNFTANIIAFFMQGLQYLFHSSKCKTHLVFFSSGRPSNATRWMNNPDALQWKARIIHNSPFSIRHLVFSCVVIVAFKTVDMVNGEQFIYLPNASTAHP